MARVLNDALTVLDSQQMVMQMEWQWQCMCHWDGLSATEVACTCMLCLAKASKAKSTHHDLEWFQLIMVSTYWAYRSIVVHNWSTRLICRSYKATSPFEGQEGSGGSSSTARGGSLGIQVYRSQNVLAIGSSNNNVF